MVALVRHARRRAAELHRELRSPRHTALRDVFECPLPAPSEFARFGEGTWVVPPCSVSGAEHIAIGDAVIILEHSVIDVACDGSSTPKLVIGDRVRLTRFVSIECAVGIEIGDDVASSDCIAIVDRWGPPTDAATRRRIAPPPGAPVRIEAGAYLGFGCVIGPGVTVGEGAFVGEGAVVLEDVAPQTVVYGNPAREIRRHDADLGRWEGPRWP